MSAVATTPTTTWDELLAGGPAGRRPALLERIATVLEALGRPPAASAEERLRSLDEALAAGGPSEVWLALAVITARLPESDAVVRAARAARLDGARAAVLAELLRIGRLDSDLWPPVEVLRDRVVVDVHHTAQALFATGIQRVTRELARRWQRDHQPVFVGWTDGYAGLRRLDDQEVRAATTGARPDVRRPPADLPEDEGTDPRDLLVPWQCSFLTPELCAEPARARRWQALVEHSGSSTGLVGYDCVPLTVAETTARGMSGGYALYLAGAARARRLAAISETAAGEFEGWRRMLAGAGLSGPDIRAIPLAVEAVRPTDADLAEARELLGVAALPIVLSVGSHEPRKNHLSLLLAAELLWRRGARFTLTLVGGNAWGAEEFDETVATLRQASRPVQVLRSLPERLLWAAYRVAYCTVLPSLHEGFGLPVVESLASGTPVITSGYGSMAECARHGGALLVDPRDPDDLAAVLGRLLDDRALRERLAAEAASVPVRSWDEYAAAVWEALVGGTGQGC